ncbi:MAG: radical SAM protein [Nanoarchaeota archaeon]|nr:radical SAM protein [Nanoarchaeota archaeon]
MNIKSLNIILNNYCNSRCQTCNIWQNKEKKVLKLQDIKKLKKTNMLLNVKDISISGGEPFLVEELEEIIAFLIENSPNLKTLFLNHNGTKPKKAHEIAMKYASKSINLCLSISLDGNKETNDKIRGINTYDKIISLLEKRKASGLDNYEIYLSTTFQKSNSDMHNLECLLQLCEQYSTKFTFRFITISENYYNNKTKKDIRPSNKQIKLVLNHLNKKKIEKEYIKVFEEFYYENKFSIVQNQNKIICTAGKEFITIKEDKKIYPCIFAFKEIGDLEKGIYNQEINLKKHAPCPCEPTECVVYPIIQH